MNIVYENLKNIIENQIEKFAKGNFQYVMLRYLLLENNSNNKSISIALKRYNQESNVNFQSINYWQIIVFKVCILLSCFIIIQNSYLIHAKTNNVPTNHQRVWGWKRRRTTLLCPKLRLFTLRRKLWYKNSNYQKNNKK